MQKCFLYLMKIVIFVFLLFETLRYEFYLSSAVLYNSSSKHYTCVRKVSEGVWVEISDTTCKFNNSFWKTLKNVHILILNKKT